MPIEVIMPKVDMDMTHGTLVAWHVKPGEAVAQGAPLFDIETAKAAMEVEAPGSGVLHHVTANAGDEVPVGSTIAWLYASGETVGEAPQGADLAQRAAPAIATADVVRDMPAVATPARAPVEPHETVTADKNVRATPAARHLARTRGAALTDLSGTGPRGRVQKADVPQAYVAAVPAPGRSDDWQAELGPLHVSRREGNGIPLLLLHGFASDSQSWSPFEQQLERSRALIRIDLPSHGRSPHRRVGDFAELAKMLVRVFDELVPAQSQVHLVGHSLGGALALSLTDIRAPNVASLTLVAPAGLGPAVNADVLYGIAGASRAESLLPWLRELPADPDSIKEDYARAVFRSRTRPGLAGAQLQMARALFPDGTQSFDLRPALRRVERPMQIVWGKQDGISDFHQAIAARGSFALHLLDGAGHIPQFEQPGRLARIVMQQIAGVESARLGKVVGD